jgi:serine/threonine-protein kinase
MRMFLDEARTAARLSHGNVCAVFELGDVDGEYYIAME